MFNNSFDLGLIKEVINKNTKALILNTPNNPSGKTFSKSFLTELWNLQDKIISHYLR